MIKYIDTNNIEIPEGFFNDLSVPKLFQWLNNFPTIDAVEVIRCKDCEYLERTDCFGECSLWNERGEPHGEMLPNDFCSYGKRK